jgi:hypothetical protein
MATPYEKAKQKADEFIAKAEAEPYTANTNYLNAISEWEEFIQKYCPGDYSSWHMANNDERGSACAKLAKLYELHPELQKRSILLGPAYLYERASEYQNVDGRLNLAAHLTHGAR